MGIPLKVSVGSDLVFVCCAGCKKGVLKEPEKMLELVRQWRAVTSALGKYTLNYHKTLFFIANNDVLSSITACTC